MHPVGMSFEAGEFREASDDGQFEHREIYTFPFLLVMLEQKYSETMSEEERSLSTLSKSVHGRSICGKGSTFPTSRFSEGSFIFFVVQFMLLY